jgi:hypothetical protein
MFSTWICVRYFVERGQNSDDVSLIYIYRIVNTRVFLFVQPLFIIATKINHRRSVRFQTRATKIATATALNKVRIHTAHREYWEIFVVGRNAQST